MSETPTPPRNHDPLREALNLSGQAQHVTEETAQKILRFLEQSAPVRRIRASQIVSAVIGSVGLALFLVGIEQAAQDIPVVDNAYGSIGMGLAFLLISGLLLRKLG
jgi:hypothetical protein